MTWNKADTKILIYRKQKGANTKIIKRDTLDRAQLPGCLTTDGARQVKTIPTQRQGGALKITRRHKEYRGVAAMAQFSYTLRIAISPYSLCPRVRTTVRWLSGVWHYLLFLVSPSTTISSLYGTISFLPL